MKHYKKRFLGLLISFLILGATNVFSQGFITSWVTTDATITIPTTGSGYNYNLTWTNQTNAGVGDGAITGQTGNYTITGLTNGDTYQVEITGAFPRIYFNNGSEKTKIQSIDQWGTIAWTSMEDAFNGCSALGYTATDAPDLSVVTSMESMFQNCTVFNGDITSWNVSNVRFMQFMFQSTKAFNQEIGTWNVNSLQSMDRIFQDAIFNQPIDAWDVSNVTNMSRAFRLANNFNQPLHNWNVSKVTNMGNMFEGVTTFNQSLANWNMESVSSVSNMLSGVGMSSVNYDSTLIGWSSQTLETGLSFGSITLKYCNAEVERQKIIDDFGWTISDGGQGNCSDMTWDGTSWSPFNPISLNGAIINGAYDVATNGDLTAHDLTINASQSLTMTSGNISITGDFDNNGNTFTQTGGTFTFNGSTTQTIAGNNSFKDLVINSSGGNISVNSATSVTGVLTLTAGTLSSGGNLTLASTSANAGATATVDFSGAGSVSGNVIQQRFLDAATQEGYRYIAPAVTGQTFADINDDISLIGLGTTYSPGSGAGYTWAYTSPAPNIFLYDQSLISGGTAGPGKLNGQSLNDASYGWETPTATSDALNPGSAMVINALSANALISFSGPLQNADVTLSLAHGGQSNSGWHLIGNPFAATLDWNAVYDDAGNSGVDATAYVFDAATQYTGTYSGYNAFTNASINGGVKDIASGQAFFIQTTSGMTGDVTLKTSHTSTTDVQFYRTNETLNWQGELRLKLADQQGHEDELLLYLIDDAQEGKDMGDAKKFFGTAWGLPEIASQAFDFPLMMDCRAPLKDSETKSFQLVLKGGATGLFTIKTATIAQFESGTEIYLEDKFTQQLIALQEGDEYDFEIDDADETISDRFWIHMKLNRVTSLTDDPVHQHVSLFAHNKQVNIQFTDNAAATSQITIYDLMGKVIYHQDHEVKQKLSIPIHHTGIYVVKVENHHGVFSQKVIIQ